MTKGKGKTRQLMVALGAGERAGQATKIANYAAKGVKLMLQGKRSQNKNRKRNSRSNGNRGNTDSLNPVSRIEAPIAAANVSRNIQMGGETVRSVSEFISHQGPTNINQVLTVPLCPWVAFQDSNGMSINWDPRLIQTYPKYMRYRIKKLECIYTGTGDTTKPVILYIAGARAVLTTAPEIGDFSMVEKSTTFNSWTPNKFTCQHDSGWHSIDETIGIGTGNATNDNRVLFWAGLLFIGISAPLLANLDASNIKFELAWTIEFEGRNPAYDTPTMTLFSGLTQDLQQSTAVGVTAGSIQSTRRVSSPASGIRRDFRAGYYVIQMTKQGFGTTSAGEATEYWDFRNAAGTEVSDARTIVGTSGTSVTVTAVRLIKNAAGTTPTEGLIWTRFALIHAQVGDWMFQADAPDTTPGTQSVKEFNSSTILRVSESKALAIYSLLTGETALPF